MDKTKVTKDLENKTLTIERSFDATKEKLWQAYADKTWFEQWWGPEGWQTTTKSFDFTPGGRIHYAMKCIDQNQGDWYGKESWGLMELESIDEPHSFTAKDCFSNSEGTVVEGMPTQRLVVTFSDEGDSSRLVSQSICQTTEQLEELVKMGMVEGFASQLNRLEALIG